MSAVRDLVAALTAVGATIELAGDLLILRAGTTPIPAVLVNRVREAKAALLDALASQTDRPVFRRHGERKRFGNELDDKVKDQVSQSLIVEWMDKHLAPSAPGRCVWCGNPKSPGAVVLPFGTEPGTHAWLHAECWHAWHQNRHKQAAMALASITADALEDAERDRQ